MIETPEEMLRAIQDALHARELRACDDTCLENERLEVRIKDGKTFAIRVHEVQQAEDW